MKCYNNYCLFYKKGNECTMEKVTIGYLGKCSECIEVSFTEEELNKKREETLIKLGKYPGF